MEPNFKTVFYEVTYAEYKALRPHRSSSDALAEARFQNRRQGITSLPTKFALAINLCAIFTVSRALVSPSARSAVLACKDAPTEMPATEMPAMEILAARKSRISPLVQLFQIGQTVHGQPPGIASVTRRFWDGHCWRVRRVRVCF
jgi:hypothetical protein